MTMNYLKIRQHIQELLKDKKALNYSELDTDDRLRALQSERAKEMVIAQQRSQKKNELNAQLGSLHTCLCRAVA